MPKRLVQRQAVRDTSLSFEEDFIIIQRALKKTHIDELIARSNVTDLSFSTGGKLLLSGSRDSTVRLWYLRTGQSQVLCGHQGRVRAVAFSSKVNLLASASPDKTVKLWPANLASYHDIKVSYNKNKEEMMVQTLHVLHNLYTLRSGQSVLQRFTR